VSAFIDVIGVSLRRRLYDVAPRSAHLPDVFWATALLVLVMAAGVGMCRLLKDEGCVRSRLCMCNDATAMHVALRVVHNRFLMCAVFAPSHEDAHRHSNLAVVLVSCDAARRFPSKLVDEIYFSTVVASTIGYGDFSPKTSARLSGGCRARG
jgi:hypothetical protein